jgi:translation initiation factor IF-1
MNGTVTAVLRGAYQVRFANGSTMSAMLSGRAKIRVVVGDSIEVELTPYDPWQGPAFCCCHAPRSFPPVRVVARRKIVTWSVTFAEK